MEIERDPKAQPQDVSDSSETMPKRQTKKPTLSRTGITTSATVRALPWTYLQLTLLPTNPTAIAMARAPPVDALMARNCLTAALSHFLGLMGAAIPVDILSIEGRDVWVRVPRQDGGAVVEACSGWIGVGEGVSSQQQAVAWRVKGKSEWLGSLVAGSPNKLFEE